MNKQMHPTGERCFQAADSGHMTKLYGIDASIQQQAASLTSIAFLFDAN